MVFDTKQMAQSVSELSEIIEQIDEQKRELDKLRPLSFENEQRWRSKLNLEWNYHSNALEGNTLTLGETRAFLYHGVTARGKPFKDYLDIKGHREAIEYIEDVVKAEHTFSEADVRELHRILLVEPYDIPAITPNGQPTKRQVRLGQYKSLPNHVRSVTGELHLYASPEETPAQMGDLMQWYQQQLVQPELHPVLIAGLFHYRFAAIHPFDDGNGRMARLLMNLILMQFGYVPLVIKDEQRSSYLLALSQADAGDIEPFMLFIAEQELEFLSLYLRAAQGESLETSDDLDKQIGLLRQQLLGKNSHQTERTATDSIQLVAVFIEPFLERLGPQLAKFDQFFERSVFGYSLSNRPYTLKSKHINIAPVTKSIVEIVTTKLEQDEIYFGYHWSEFIELE
ncbi:MAG: Fic family protein, partial [Chloroflexota bacterium]